MWRAGGGKGGHYDDVGGVGASSGGGSDYGEGNESGGDDGDDGDGDSISGGNGICVYNAQVNSGGGNSYVGSLSTNGLNSHVYQPNYEC